MRMYVRVMAAVIACILLSGEALSAFAITPATENLSWFKKKKKKPEEREEKSKSDYEWKAAKRQKECLLYIKRKMISILKFLPHF